MYLYISLSFSLTLSLSRARAACACIMWYRVKRIQKPRQEEGLCRVRGGEKFFCALAAGVQHPLAWGGMNACMRVWEVDGEVGGGAHACERLYVFLHLLNVFGRADARA